ncbi:MAG: gephyrin-like molybdotransferase Glp [Planctomycetota bacterium]
MPHTGIMPGMGELLSVAEALRLIELQADALPPRRAADLSATLGLVLAEDVTSDIDSPPHNKAMMDGYAVRSADGLADRQVVDEVFAGDVPRVGLSPGTATKIMTGAPMPAGADAVVPVEKTQSEGDVVRFTGAVPVAGKHVMPRGESIAAGSVVLKRGSVVRSAEVALLAEVGGVVPPVIPRPRVAVLATGAELVSADQRPGPGQIRNSNGPMLLAALAEAGADGVALGAATDDADALRQAITAGRDADVLLLSGGVSAGDRDLAPGVLADLGVKRVFHKVAVKPGKPLWFGVWERPDESAGPTYVFGLPGNPVSSFVSFQLFVRPLLAALSGRGFCGLVEERAVLADELSHPGGRETYLPAIFRREKDTPASIRPVAWRGSADLAGLTAANAFLRLSADPAELSVGDPVSALLLPN